MKRRRNDPIEGVDEVFRADEKVRRPRKGVDEDIRAEETTRRPGRGGDETARRPGKGERKRKKRRKKNYALRVILILLALIGAYFIATSDLFEIRTINVASADHYTDTKIVEMSGVKTGENLFKAKMRAAVDRLEKDPYIDAAKVERKPPHGVLITVREREEKLLVKQGDEYVVLDYSGMVLRKTKEPPSLPIVENIEIKGATPGRALAVSSDLLLSDTIRLLEATEKNGLYFKRVVASDVVVSAYVYDTLAVKGTYENIISGLEELRTVILDLDEQKIKRGAVIMSGNGACTFTPEED